MKMQTGSVIKSTGSWHTVRSTANHIIQCKIKGTFRTHGIRATNPLAVGDKVEFELFENNDTGIFTKLYSRKNYLIRRASRLSSEYQIIASNIDVAWIVASLVASLVAPKTYPEFIDRFLFLAAQLFPLCHQKPLIWVLSKFVSNNWN